MLTSVFGGLGLADGAIAFDLQGLQVVAFGVAGFAVGYALMLTASRVELIRAAYQSHLGAASVLFGVVFWVFAVQTAGRVLGA